MMGLINFIHESRPIKMKLSYIQTLNGVLSSKKLPGEMQVQTLCTTPMLSILTVPFDMVKKFAHVQVLLAPSPGHHH